MDSTLVLVSVVVFIVGFFSGITAVFLRCTKSPAYFEKFKADISELRDIKS